MQDKIQVFGARVHNLKNIDVEIPRNSLTVITGLSGSGAGQRVRIRFADGSGVKMTRYQYFSPNGRAIHGNGITPDYIVELTEDCFDEEGNLISDPQLDKAIELLR